LIAYEINQLPTAKGDDVAMIGLSGAWH
jgi:hypothetical protein